MRRTGMVMALAVGLLMLGGTVSAQAATYTFNFNSLAATTASTSTTNASLAIQNYMDGVLTADGCKGCSVTVSGAVADTTYNGDGHVVGSKVGTNTTYTSLTLGDSNNATGNNASINHTGNTINYDTFISNTDNSSNQRDDEITIKLVGFTLNGNVSFDYEVFPDGTGETPDFTFATNVNSNVFTKDGTKPSATNAYGDGTATHSPNSGNSAETSLQWIGTYSGSVKGVNQLDFVDWPATIGVDNLVISTPEPGTLFLLGVGLSGLLLLTKKKVTA